MRKMKLLALLTFFSTFIVKAQPTPPQGKQWELVENMSDEFNTNSLNTTKWQITNATGWVGRSPGLFIDNAISVGNGNLKITNTKLLSPVTVNGQNFTHGCGLVASKNAMTYGYFECRMKANKTFMSSTFWLINNRNQGNGCDKRVTELDIQETVGAQSGPSWVQNTMRGMNSNTHSRQVTCSTTPEGINGDNKTLTDQAWQSYHTYGAWWKSKNEVLFYLDGVYEFTVTPPSDFDLPMYLRMVTETYDWNPVPADGGMTGNVDSRTTYYDWVHAYKLIDALDVEDFSTTATEKIKLYPNPAKDFITIKGIETGDAISITDLPGKTIFESKAKNTLEIIPIDFLASGIYMVLINGEKRKLIVE